MSVTPESFREQYREFMDAGAYTDDLINFWNTTGLMFLQGNNAAGSRWGQALDYATGLFIAHHLVLGARNQAIAAAGGIPGEVKGPATNKSVDKVSQGYDTKAVTFANGAFWNQTSYGIALFNLFEMFGAGGVQLGMCDAAGFPINGAFGAQV